MSLANRDNFASFFPTPSLFSCLIVLVRIFSIMLNRNSESGYSCVVPDHIGKVFKLSLLSKMLAQSLSDMVFIMLRYIPSLSNFLTVFILNEY